MSYCVGSKSWKGDTLDSGGGAMALLLLLAFLLVPAARATTFHRIETIPLDREVENNLVSEEQDEKGGEIDAGFFLPYRKFTDTPG